MPLQHGVVLPITEVDARWALLSFQLCNSDQFTSAAPFRSVDWSAMWKTVQTNKN